MSVLEHTLYRTNKSVIQACEELGLEYTQQVIDDLSGMLQCAHCSVWFYDYELIPDRDGSDVCKFCHDWYQYG